MALRANPDVLILGAGALGLCTAAELHRRGARVMVVDPGGANASSIAAGMLAPALETALEALPPAYVAVGVAARDLWPALAERTGVILHRDGAEWRGATPQGAAARLAAVGFRWRPAPQGIFTPDDWRLEPEQALQALGRGVERVAGRAARVETDASVVLDDGRRLTAGHVVAAFGAAPAVDAPPALARLMARVRPIKGQILRLEGVPQPTHVIRAPGVYIVPSSRGVIVGATMEEGRFDCTVEAAVTETLLSRARALAPELAGARLVVAQAGLRGASPDGLPMAGPTAVARLHAALAPRRNGWLLAPLVAGIVADGIEGRAPGVHAPVLDPGRFAD